MRDVELLYFDGCPHWQVADHNLRSALDEAGWTDTEVHYRRVETVEEAERLEFVGSPTILVDGVDPFAEPNAAVGLTCRLYPTPNGLTGAPTIEQLRAALDDPRGG